MNRPLFVGNYLQITWCATLGDRDFFSAVSSFCHVFMVTRASPLVASAFGQHRKFPPHARTTSGTQGSGGLSANENEKHLHRAIIYLIISFPVNPSFALSKCRITIQPSFSCSPFTSIGEKSEIRVYRNSFWLEGFVGNTRVDKKCMVMTDANLIFRILLLTL